MQYLEHGMLNEYLKAAMRKAHYELLDVHEGFCGEIPRFDGIIAQGSTLEECRDELAGVLEDWLLFRISRQLPIPSVDGMTLEIKEVAAV
jgi:predicted RNase H-like HicB family nuclease